MISYLMMLKKKNNRIKTKIKKKVKSKNKKRMNRANNKKVRPNNLHKLMKMCLYKNKQTLKLSILNQQEIIVSKLKVKINRKYKRDNRNTVILKRNKRNGGD